MSELMSWIFLIVSPENTCGISAFHGDRKGEEEKKIFNELVLKSTSLLQLNVKGVLK